MFAALAYLLDFVAFKVWAQGGSVSLSMLPVFLIAYRWGLKGGLLTGSYILPAFILCSIVLVLMVSSSNRLTPTSKSIGCTKNNYIQNRNSLFIEKAVSIECSTVNVNLFNPLSYSS
jgi:hypothetical protein